MTAKRARTRRAAPARPRAIFAVPPAGDADRRQGPGSDEHLQKLLHELQIHAEEITVQNEQLIKAQAELEHTRDRYADLYDFAPVGYVSIDSRATIVDINLAGAALLGRPRSFVLQMPFATMIVPEHLEVLRGFLILTRQHAAGAALQTEVRVRAHPDRIIRLVARPLGIGPGPSRLLTAMFDVTEERRLEEERAAALGREQQRAAELAREVETRTLAEARVKSLLERLVTVQEEERRRIARNLHDHLGQQLTALRLSIGALKDGPVKRAELRHRLEAIDKIASQVDRDVDFLAWDLRPPTLDEVGLNAALENIVREWSATQGVNAEFHASQEAVRVAAEIESHLYRIVQEALNNVSKHAAATHVSVLLEHKDNDVILIVEDDGRGFDAEAVASSHDQRGMGLTGMQERMALVGGEIEIESTPGKGTTIFARVPISAAMVQKK
jgi:two-component system, NarL family, sensor histidine kinase NreB